MTTAKKTATAAVDNEESVAETSAQSAEEPAEATGESTLDEESAVADEESAVAGVADTEEATDTTVPPTETDGATDDIVQPAEPLPDRVGRKGARAEKGAARAASVRAPGIRLRVGDRVRLPVVIAAASAVVLASAGSGFSAWHFADARSDLRHTVAVGDAQSADRDAALKVGGDFLATAYTVDAVNDKGMAKWNAAMTAATTDTLKEQVRQTKALLSLLAESNASMSGAVSDAAVISQNDTLIRMLAVVELTGKAPGQNDPTTGSVTEYVDLMKVDRHWKVFGYKDIGSKTGPGQPDAGLPGLPGLPAIQPAAPAK
ncbi:MAG: hypothetical protein JWN03_7316 [Nocardia sp.]|uniref:hypothetical protein n=1 Tax=Nocardia sp. TaxID=1821 RepID=UPI002612A965|nr:hypothetical protein [Nocardia sp.]MCU1647041.1 hypothetical protein [Nocardia sp.]